jgi:hypothetical protein
MDKQVLLLKTNNFVYYTVAYLAQVLRVLQHPQY